MLGWLRPLGSSQVLVLAGIGTSSVVAAAGFGPHRLYLPFALLGEIVVVCGLMLGVCAAAQTRNRVGLALSASLSIAFVGVRLVGTVFVLGIESSPWPTRELGSVGRSTRCFSVWRGCRWRESLHTSRRMLLWRHVGHLKRKLVLCWRQ